MAPCPMIEVLQVLHLFILFVFLSFYIYIYHTQRVAVLDGIWLIDGTIPERFYRTIDLTCSTGYLLRVSFAVPGWYRLVFPPGHQFAVAAVVAVAGRYCETRRPVAADRCWRSCTTTRWTASNGRWLNLSDTSIQRHVIERQQKEKKEKESCSFSFVIRLVVEKVYRGRALEIVSVECTLESAYIYYRGARNKGSMKRVEGPRVRLATLKRW